MANNKGSDTNRKQRAPHCILIVEDEMMLAMMLEDAVLAAGYRARKVARLSRAMELAGTEHFDAAVLDVNLAGQPVFPLAALLRKRGVPFLFSTGYGDAGLPDEYRGCLVLQKPYGLEAFDGALRDVLKDSAPERVQNPT